MMRTILPWLRCVAIAGVAAFVLPVHAQLPAVTLETAPLVSPTAAWAYYGSSNTHTAGVAAWSSRPPELQELSRALGAGRYTTSAYANTVYEYVRNNIEIDFRFGLSKGALGAVIDQSGTAFDQAHLMVELLRQGGVTANYVVGTITLTGSQFSAWSGFTNAQAACQFLADGGIPASVNGASSCSGLSGNVTTVTLAHIWVSANAQLYDPSYKAHVVKTGMDLPAAMGCGTAAAPTCTTALLGAVPNSKLLSGTSNVNFVSGVNESSIDSTLLTYATNLQHWIQSYNATNKTELQVNDLIGGVSIDPSAPFAAGAALPYTTSTQYTWTGDIPDQYRTVTRIQFDNIDQTLFADEFYGSRIRVWGYTDNATTWGTANGVLVTRHTTLYLEYKPLQRSDLNNTNHAAPLTLTVNHPYAANNGTYADEVTTRNPRMAVTPCDFAGSGCTTNEVDLSQFTIVLGLGDANESSVQHYANLEQRDLNFTTITDTLNPNYIWIGPNLLANFACLKRYTPVIGINVNVSCYEQQDPMLSAEWLAQATQIRVMSSQIASGTMQHHHSIGYVLSGNSLMPGEVYLDIDSRVSAASKNASPGDRQGLFSTMTASLSRLEGGVQQQSFKTWNGGDATSNMVLSNRQGIPFLLVNSGNISAATAHLSNYTSTQVTQLQSYASANYNMMVPQNGYIGSFSPVSGQTATFFTNGMAAYSQGMDSIAYLAIDRVNQDLKGAAGMPATDPPDTGLQLTSPGDYSQKKRKDYGVNLQTGALKITPEPYIVTGQGKFPNSLSYQEFYDSETVNSCCWSPVNYPYDEYNFSDDGNSGWDNNFDLKARMGSDGMAGLGRESAADASSALTGLYVLQLLNGGSQDYHSNLASIFAADWFVGQLNNNVVIVKKAPEKRIFVRLPDLTYNAEHAEKDQLIQTGNVAFKGFSSGDGSANWDYSPVSFKLIEGDGSVLSFKNFSGTGMGTGNYFIPTTWTFPTGVTITYQFASVSASATICMTKASNNLGRSLTFADSSCNALPIQSDDGRQVTITPWDGKSRKVTTPDNNVTEYDYLPAPLVAVQGDYKAKITKWFTPSSSTVPFLTFTYDSLYRVSAVTDNSVTPNTTNYYVGGLYGTENQKRGESVDPLGGVSTSYFDTHNNLLSNTDALNRTTYYAYDGARRVSTVTYPEGNAVVTSYDARSNITSRKQISKPGSGYPAITTATTYTEAATVATCTNAATCNNPATTKDANGNVITYTYDAISGLVKTITGPAVTGGNALTTFCYTSKNGITLLTGTVQAVDASSNRVKSYTYDSTNNYVLLTATVDPSTSLDSGCNTVAKSGALNLVTAYTFWPDGDPNTVDGPRTDVNDVMTYTYDNMRRLHQVDGPAGSNVKTIYNYDNDGLLHTVQRQEMVNGAAVLRTETRDYWPTGDLKAVKDPDNYVTQYLYDGVGRLTDVTDPDLRVTHTIYDLAGQPLQVFKGWGSTKPGMPITYATYTYSPNGKTLTDTDADGNETDYSFDGQDRLTYTLYPSPVDGSRCSEVPFAGSAPTCDSTKQQVYDADLYTIDGTKSGARCNGSDAPCRHVTRKGDTITWSYDALNRASTKAVPGLPLISYAYNLAGDMTSACTTLVSGACVAHTVGYGYDDAGRRSYEANDGMVVGYGYDGDNNRITTTWPDGYYVSYQYDGLHRMQAAWEGAVGTRKLADYSIDELSRRKAVTFAGNASNSVTYSYDPNNYLDSLTNQLNTTSVILTYGWNKSGQFTSVTSTDSSLLSAPAPSATASYGVNKLNQYSTIGASALSYNANGDLLTWNSPDKGLQTYTYDAEDRLRAVALNGSSSPSITYDYDPLGRRVSKTVNGTKTGYLLDGAEEIAELDGAGWVQRRFIDGPTTDDRIADAEGSTASNPPKTYYHVNHQGSVLAMTDSAGNVTQSMTYDEYGNLSTGTATTGQQFRYAGRRFDAETGLYYYRSRYYSPALGRFLQADPIGNKDDLNLYAYVKDDPVNHTDPSGECLEDLCIGEGMAIIEGIQMLSLAFEATGVTEAVADSAFAIRTALVSASALKVATSSPVRSIIKSAAESLPEMKGMGAAERNATLKDAGFNRTKVSNSPAKNEVWEHPDGSEVRVHPYGDQNRGPFNSGNNAHLHKEDPAGNQLTDRGIPSTDKSLTHIGLPDPADFQLIRNRPMGGFP